MTFVVYVTGLFAWSQFAPSHGAPTVDTPSPEELEPVAATGAAGTGLNYSTSFEPGEGFTPGYVKDQPVGCGGVANPCWGVTSRVDRSLVEGHIDTTHPLFGAQHLRLSWDPSGPRPTESFGLGVDARFPRSEDLSVQPVAPSTMTVHAAVDSWFGQDFRIQPQSPSEGKLIASLLFFYSGSIYYLDGCNGDIEWHRMAYWSPGYLRYWIVIDPCNDLIKYGFVENTLRTTCLPFGRRLEQLVIFGDNYPGASMDIDDVVLQTGDPCPVYGSCCDTNGPDQGCTDSVVEADCLGADKVWTEGGTCAGLPCDCLPECGGRECGDDGCGGICGVCDDGIACTIDLCVNNFRCTFTPDHGSCGNNDACDGAELCSFQSGCVPGMPIHCDDGVACNGIETCNPNSGCVAGTPVNCDDGLDCTVDACNEPDGSCTHDDADCAIPTVSDWGLVILALALLVIAKMWFSSIRRAS